MESAPVPAAFAAELSFPLVVAGRGCEAGGGGFALEEAAVEAAAGAADADAASADAAGGTADPAAASLALILRVFSGFLRVFCYFHLLSLSLSDDDFGLLATTRTDTPTNGQATFVDHLRQLVTR